MGLGYLERQDGWSFWPFLAHSGHQRSLQGPNCTTEQYSLIVVQNIFWSLQRPLVAEMGQKLPKTPTVLPLQVSQTRQIRPYVDIFVGFFFQILQQVNLLKWLPMKPYKFKVFLNFILITPQTWKNNYNILDDKSRNRVYKEKLFNFIYCLLTKAGKLEGFSVN